STRARAAISKTNGWGSCSVPDRWTRDRPPPARWGSGERPQTRPSLQGYGLLLPLQGRFEGVPGQARTLHADGELADAGQDRELAEGGVDRIPRAGRDHLVESLEEAMGIRLRLALHRVRHQRCGGFRDRAPLADERYVLDRSVVEAHVHGHPIPAQLVVAHGRRAGGRDLPEITGPLTVIQDRILVQLSEIRHQGASRRVARVQGDRIESRFIRSPRGPRPSAGAKRSADRA